MKDTIFIGAVYAVISITHRLPELVLYIILPLDVMFLTIAKRERFTVQPQVGIVLRTGIILAIPQQSITCLVNIAERLNGIGQLHGERKRIGAEHTVLEASQLPDADTVVQKSKR